MAAGRPTIISSEALVSSDEVRHKGFATAFRGFDTNEVRSFLARVADELRSSRDRYAELERRLADAETRAAHPVLDESTLLGALGDETARIVHSARDAAADIKAKAEEAVERLLREAGDDAARIRGEADGLLASRTDEADTAAAQIREAAQAWADEVRSKAREEAESIIDESKRHGREMVEEAQALRVKILGDLTRRRKVAMVQVEQLRAGRERLLEAYRTVRQTLDEVTDELSRAEAEARVAAELAGHKAGEEAEPTEEELEVAASIAASLGDVGTTREPASSSSDVGGEAVSTGAASTAAPAAPAVEVVSVVTPADEPSEAAADERSSASGPTTGRASKPSIDPGPDERRLSSLRILRRPKPEPESAVPAAASVHEPVTGEGVRVIRAEPAAASASKAASASLASTGGGVAIDDEPAPRSTAPDSGSEAQPAAAETGVGETTEAGDATEVDALFARIRASRAAQVVEAEEVLAAAAAQTEASPVDGERSPEAGGDASTGSTDTDAPRAVEGETVTEGDTGDDVDAESESESEPVVANADESVLQQRDSRLEPIVHNLSRKLKRALQDDQNDLLDRLRTSRGKVSADLVGGADEHAGRFRLAAYDQLADAARAGAAFALGVDDAGADVTLPAIADVADELAQGITGPLRTRLEQALADAVAEHDDEQAVIERVGAAYREWKSQRIERLAGDHVVSSFSRGAYAVTAEGAQQRWVVDDVDGPCPDCDDNALAGPTGRGQAFPTGQVHPPAHPGCRCVLVPDPA